MIAVFRRELVSLLRSPKTVVMQLAMIVALGLLVFLRWPTSGTAAMDGSSSSQVLGVFGWGLLAAMVLIVPVYPATSIVREKVQGTLGLVLNSPIRLWELVLGKLASNVAFVLILVFLSLPAAGATYAMGGVGLSEQLLPMYLVLVLVALQYATLGLLVSSYVQSADAALRVVYSVVLILSVLVLGPYAAVGRSAWLPGGLVEAVGWLRCVSPIPAMSSVLGSGGAIGDDVVWRFCVLASASSIAAAVLTWARLRSGVLDRSRETGRITDEQSGRVQLLRRIMFLWFFDPQRRSALIGPWQNPVMVKEQRCRRFGRSGWMARLIGLCMVVSLLLVIAATRLSQSQGVEGMGGVMVIMQMSLIIVLTPSLAAGMISTEIESRGWQLLQMTPMSPRQIVTGKLLSVWMTLSLVLLATLPAYLVLVLIDPGQLQIATGVFITLILTALLAMLISACVSSLTRRTAAATATSYAILMALCAGPILIWMARDAPFNHSVVEAALQINPLAAALSLIGFDGFTTYSLLPGNWYFLGVVSLVCLLLLVVRVGYLTRPR